MIRAFAAFALAGALSACGVLGPPQGDLERAVQTYYANGVPRPNIPDLRGATVVDFEGCRPLRGYYQSPSFSRPSPAACPP